MIFDVLNREAFGPKSQQNDVFGAKETSTWVVGQKSMIRVGFEPTPFRTSALSWRLRPLGHLTFVTVLGGLIAQIPRRKPHP